MHAPEVECIGKGKARKPYEFGVKAAVVVSHQHGLMLGARTFPGNPYDGHILSAVLEQTANLTQDLPVKVKHVVVDLGFRGVDADNPDKELIHRGKLKSLSKQQKGWLLRAIARLGIGALFLRQLLAALEQLLAAKASCGTQKHSWAARAGQWLTTGTGRKPIFGRLGWVG